MSIALTDRQAALRARDVHVSTSTDVLTGSRQNKGRNKKVPFSSVLKVAYIVYIYIYTGRFSSLNRVAVTNLQITGSRTGKREPAWRPITRST